MTTTNGAASEPFDVNAVPAGDARVHVSPDRDRVDAIDQLELSAAAFRAAIRDLSDAQWTFKPSADRWSIGECADHLVIVEERWLGLVQRLAQTAPGHEPAALSDEDVVARALDRSTRIAAPERIQPTARSADRQATLAAFNAARQRSLEFVHSTDADLRARTARHPVLGALDGHQWVLAAAAHLRRHVGQIDEIKSAPGFPR
jgi:uncharacterized damage-inducible protein DinB